MNNNLLSVFILILPFLCSAQIVGDIGSILRAEGDATTHAMKPAPPCPLMNSDILANAHAASAASCEQRAMPPHTL